MKEADGLNQVVDLTSGASGAEGAGDGTETPLVEEVEPNPWRLVL